MIRNEMVFLSALLLVTACGGAKGAQPANSGDEASVSEPMGETESAVTETADDGMATPSDPESAEASEAEAAADSTENADEQAVETAPSAEEAPPSDDLQSYVGTGGAYTPEYRTVTDNMDTIKQCYLDAIRVDPDIQGTLKVRFTVNKAGKAIKAKAVSNELNDQVATCVIGTIQKLKFPKRADKRTVEYPFKFIPGP